MPVEIHVTVENILDGIRLSSAACPVALAILDLFPDADVEVNQKVLMVDSRCFPVPREVAEFMLNFDSRNPVRPIAFTLDLPEKYQS